MMSVAPTFASRLPQLVVLTEDSEHFRLDQARHLLSKLGRVERYWEVAVDFSRPFACF